MDVSVIIATYNRAAYLGAAIDSVIAQTTGCRIEIAVIDDGSTDATATMMRPYVERFGDRGGFRYVNYIRQEKLGVVAARNTGLAQTGAPLVAFLDSDDTWDKHKLQRQIEAMRMDDAVVAAHTSFRYIDTAGELADDGPQRPDNPCAGDCVKELLREDVVIFSSVMMRRRAIEQAAAAQPHGQAFAPGLTNAQDYDLLLRVALLGRFVYIPDALTFYRRHDTHGAMGNLKQAFGYHCRVQRDFVRQYGDLLGVSEQQVGDYIGDFLFQRAESAFWRRQLDVVNDLCELAGEQAVSGPRFEALMRKAARPAWLYRIRDGLGRVFG